MGNIEGNNQEFIPRDANPEMYKEEDMLTLEAHIQKYFGDCENVWHEIYSPDIHVDIYVIAPNEERDYYTLVTMGMGAHRMNVPAELAEYKLERAELMIMLPPDWKLTQEDMRNEQWYWPIRLLKSIARLPGEDDTWVGWGHTVALNEGETYADNTELCGTMLIGQQAADSEADVCRISGGEEVNFYQLIPLYLEEMEYKLDNDADALLEMMDDVSMVVDIHRHNVMNDSDSDADDDEDEELYNKFMEMLMDDADMHLESIHEKNLPVDEITAYNHLAIYLRWCIEHNLMSDSFLSEYEDEVSAVRAGMGNMPDLRVLLRDDEDLGGLLITPYFNDEGAAFADWYYKDRDDEEEDDIHYFPCDIDDYAEGYFGTKRYYSDEFQDEAYLFVPWTEQYYQDMAAIIDKRFAAWKKVKESRQNAKENTKETQYPFHVTLQLNARFQPVHRHYLEDAIESILDKQKLGEVDGGGTMQLPSGEIEFCDIEINLKDNAEETVKRLEEIIDALGVPKGSKLYTHENDMEIPVGRQEGLAVYLNGTELPDEVYQECDINYVIEHMEELMGEAGKMYSYWEGPNDTALYFYGESYDKMLEAVQDFLNEYPLCAKCVINRIA